jgi:hypothetical protein
LIGRFNPVAKYSLTLTINFTNMDIHAEKLLLIRGIEQINDRSLLQTLKKLMINYGLEKEGRISIEQYNRELEEAEAEFARGEYITHEELKKQMKEW